MKLAVPEMSCGHCIRAIEMAIKAEDPQAAVACDLTTRTILVESTLTADRLSEVLKAAGYESREVAP